MYESTSTSYSLFTLHPVSGSRLWHLCAICDYSCLQIEPNAYATIHKCWYLVSMKHYGYTDIHGTIWEYWYFIIMGHTQILIVGDMERYENTDIYGTIWEYSHLITVKKYGNILTFYDHGTIHKYWHLMLMKCHKAIKDRKPCKYFVYKQCPLVFEINWWKVPSQN